jgi:hypothetical protein
MDLGKCMRHLMDLNRQVHATFLEYKYILDLSRSINHGSFDYLAQIIKDNPRIFLFLGYVCRLPVSS